MYIQPCCIAKELPALLRKDAQSWFQSNGDWTIYDLMAAVAHLAPHSVMILALPEADAYLLRTLRTWMAKGWLRAVVLVTGEPCADLVKQIMPEDAYQNRLAYALEPRLYDGFLGLVNGRDYLFIQGTMLLQKDYALCHYAAYYGRNADRLREADEALIAKVRVGATIKGGDRALRLALNHDYGKIALLAEEDSAGASSGESAAQEGKEAAV